MFILVLLPNTVYNFTSYYDGNMQMSLIFNFSPYANDGGDVANFTNRWFDVGQKTDKRYS